MSQIRGIDVSFNKPDYVKVRTVGYTFVIRYLSNDPSKNLSATERDDILGLGLGLGLIWEAGATDWQNSATAKQEAETAVQQAINLGVPAGVCIYAANDANASAQQVAPGFNSARPTIKQAGYLLGIYAGDTVTDILVSQGICDMGWQAAATSWGDGKVSAVCSLFQRVAKTLPDCGGAYDEDVLLKVSAGLWLPPGQSVPPKPGGGGVPALAPPPPKPPSVPIAPPFPGRDLRFPPLTTGADVREWQTQMARRGWHIAIDGVYGPASRQVCLAFQREKRLNPDGIVGPVTWAASWTAPVT